MTSRTDLKLAPELPRCCALAAAHWITDRPDDTVRDGDRIHCGFCRADTMIVRADRIVVRS